MTGHFQISNIYYVYWYKDPFTNLPFYIGKGKGRRYLFHLYEAKNINEEKITNKHKYRKIKKVISQGYEPIIEIIYDNLTLSESYIIEKNMIEKYGRVDIGTGILTNLSDGGDGPLNRVSSERGTSKNWIYKGNHQKLIYRSELQKYLDDGWMIGRIRGVAKTPWNKGISLKGTFSKRNQSGRNNPNSNCIWLCLKNKNPYIAITKKELLKSMDITDIVIDRMFRKGKYMKNRSGVTFVMKIKTKEVCKCNPFSIM